MGATEIVMLLFGAAVFLGAVALSQTFQSRRAPPAPDWEKPVELLETKVSGIKSDQRKLSGEWVDYHSRIDTLIRRGIRLGVIERKENEGAAAGNDENHTPAPAAAPLTRGSLVSKHRRKNAATKSPT